MLRQPGACRFHAVAKGCSRSNGSQHDIVWARSHEGVVRKAVSTSAAASEVSFWAPLGFCVIFFTESVVESQSFRMKWVEKYFGLATADMLLKMSDKLGRDGHRREWRRAAAFATSVLIPPSSGTPDVSVHGSAELPRNGMSRRDCF